MYTEEDQVARHAERALRTALTQGGFEAERWWVRKNGTRVWPRVVINPVLSESGELLGFAKITRDVSDRKESEQAPCESELRFRLLVQGVDDYAICKLFLDVSFTLQRAGLETVRHGHGATFSWTTSQSPLAAGLCGARNARSGLRQGSRPGDEHNHARYEGLTYHFCSGACRAKFIAALDEYAGTTAKSA